MHFKLYLLFHQILTPHNIKQGILFLFFLYPNFWQPSYLFIYFSNDQLTFLCFVYKLFLKIKGK